MSILAQIMGAACSQDSPYAEHAERLTDQLTTTLSDRLKAVGLSADVAEFRATITIAATQGLITRRGNHEDPAQIDARYRRLLDTFVLAPISLPKQIPELLSESPKSRGPRQPRLR